jgi:hypothetical protein
MLWRLSATEIVKFILMILNWPDNESTTHNSGSIFQNTSGFNPEIAVRRITDNIVSFCQGMVTAVRS